MHPAECSLRYHRLKTADHTGKLLDLFRFMQLILSSPLIIVSDIMNSLVRC